MVERSIMMEKRFSFKSIKNFVSGVAKAISDSTQFSKNSATSLSLSQSYSQQLFNASTHCTNKAGTVTFDASAAINAGGSASVNVLVWFEYLPFCAVSETIGFFGYSMASMQQFVLVVSTMTQSWLSSVFRVP
jgi:hypothetical protein